MEHDLDIKFYRRVYPDLRFLSDQQLVNHYNEHGKKENRLGSLSQLNEFISDLPYVYDETSYREYPDVPMDILGAKIHFYMHGFPEGRIYSRSQLASFNIENEQEVETDIAKIDTRLSKDTSKKINILIRTHNRPGRFLECISSVMSQNYPNYHVYICAQSPGDLQYINQTISSWENISVIHGEKTSDDEYFFNDFMNQLLDVVTSGWVINLDDDDMFTTPYALPEIAKHITLDDMIVWKYKRPDKIIFPEGADKLTSPGKIASPSYCIHSSVAKTSRWPTKRQGDFDYIKPIYNNLNIQLLDLTLTKYQLRNKTASFGGIDSTEFSLPEKCQLHTSSSLSHLHSRFVDKYELLSYSSTTQPCIFFGFYTPNDFKAFYNHSGPRLIIFGGSDCDLRIPGGKENILKLTNSTRKGDQFLYISEDIHAQLASLNVTSKKFSLNLVDTKLFYPRDTTGSKVFIYNGMNGKGNKTIYGEEHYTKVVNKLPAFEFVYSNDLYLPYEDMPEIYSQCFIGLRLTNRDGNANMVQEFQAMNLPVVHNNSVYGLKWHSYNDIIEHITAHNPLE